MFLEKSIKELSDKELKESFDEITDWIKTGMLKDGIVRKMHKNFIEENKVDFSIYNIERFFTYEMACRWVKTIE